VLSPPLPGPRHRAGLGRTFAESGPPAHAGFEVENPGTPTLGGVAGGGDVERKRVEAEADKAHGQLLVSPAKRGWLKVAIGVLHNVGNVLNSVNVSVPLWWIGAATKSSVWAKLWHFLRDNEKDLARI